MNVDAELVSVYPQTDVEFKRTVEAALANPGGRAIDDAGVLAAAMALVRTSYPLATLQVRRGGQSDRWNVWDAFRDADVLDHELVGRARSGDAGAVDQLYERHQRLVHAVALQAAPDSASALGAAVAAFRTVIAEHAGHPPVRIGLAVAARDAARRAAGAGSNSRSALETAVVELALGHRLKATDIAQIMRLEMPALRMLAIDGLQTFPNVRPESSR